MKKIAHTTFNDGLSCNVGYLFIDWAPLITFVLVAAKKGA